jgi:hypothetical protein
VKLTIEQAITYAQRAGFSGAGLATIVAIAQAETAGTLDTMAYNPNDPNGGSFGVLQINGAHFGEAWAGGVMSQAQADDPQIAFNYAYVLSQKGTNFNDWGTYNPKNGTTPAYLQYMNKTRSPVAAPVSSSTSSGPFDAIVQFFSGISTFTDWLSNPVRIIKLVNGIFLLGIAIFLLVSQSETVAKMEGTAAKIATF